MVGIQLPDRELAMNLNLNPWRSLAPLLFKGLDDKGRPAVEMVVDALVQAAPTLHASSDVRHHALRIVDHVDILRIGDS